MKTRKKIVFISTVYGVSWGGSEELWAKTALHLLNTEKDISISIIVKKWEKPHPRIKELCNAGAQVIYITRLSRINRIRKVLLKDKYVSTAEQILFKVKPNLVVVSQGSYFDGIAWCKFLIKNQFRYVTITQAASENWWVNDVQMLEIRQTYRSALINFFVSKENERLIQNQIGFQLENAMVISNPYNVPYGQYLIYPNTGEIFNLAVVGRINFNAKGQDIILHVLKDSKWKKRPIRVNFYGEGPNTELLKTLIHLYGLEEKCNFCGTSKDITEVWAQNQMLLLPSRHEGLPLALVEAMMCGRGAIVTDVAGNKEIVDDNVTGFLAKAPTVELVDEAMERAWSRRYEWEHIGEKAAKAIIKKVPCKPELEFGDELMYIVNKNL